MRLTFDRETIARGERHAKYLEDAGSKQEVSRGERRSLLSQQDYAIRMALDAYKRVDHGNVDVQIRSVFVRLSQEREARLDVVDEHGLSEAWLQDRTSRPPCTWLIHRQNNGLRMYLSTIYLSHLEGRPGAVPPNNHRLAVGGPTNPSWACLAGLYDRSRRVARMRVARSLESLQECGLVELQKQTPPRVFEGFTIQAEDGHGDRYKVPGGGKAIALPHGFFYHGWHLVLAPREVALLLVLLEMQQHTPIPEGQIGIALPGDLRWARYGVTGEVYGSHHELEEFGLIKLIDTMPGRRRGKLQARRRSLGDEQSFAPEPYRFLVLEDAFDRPAYDVITKSLMQYSKPPRFYH